MAFTAAALGVILLPFNGWKDLAEKSPDIVIVQCTTNPAPGPIMDGMIWSDIEVISVLKGEGRTGLSRMVSQYRPHAGERFLLFGGYQSNELYQAYNATESYRVIPLAFYFSTNALAGKTLDQQIRLIVEHRLEVVKQELKERNEEKARLESFVREIQSE
jgi:hypothetical protein